MKHNQALMVALTRKLPKKIFSDIQTLNTSSLWVLERYKVYKDPSILMTMNLERDMWIIRREISLTTRAFIWQEDARKAFVEETAKLILGEE